MIDPLPEKQREFLAIMGLADEFTAEMARFVTEDPEAEALLVLLTARNAFVKRAAGRRDLPLSPHDEGVRGAHVPDAGTGTAAPLPAAVRRMVRGTGDVPPRPVRLPPGRGL